MLVTDGALRVLTIPFMCIGTSKRQFRALIVGSPTTISQKIVYFCLMCQRNNYPLTPVLIVRHAKLFSRRISGPRVVSDDRQGAMRSVFRMHKLMFRDRLVLSIGFGVDLAK